MSEQISPQKVEPKEKNRIVGGMLYLVATPIGNLADLSDRAKKVLSEVSFIAAEDTRNAIKLLNFFGIRKEIISYYEHNRRQRGPQILERLQSGESCALVTDAGMPAISDPGSDMVKLCADASVPVTVVPGCCAAVTALALSALPTTRFAFEGFLPVDGKERKLRFEEIHAERRTMIFYEAPHKLVMTLHDLYHTFGDRKISICRELTKINEEIMRTTLSAAISYYTTEKPRGEYVLVLEGAEAFGLPTEKEVPSPLLCLSPEEKVAYLIREQGLPRMEAIKVAAKEMGISKSELYKALCHHDENE